MQVCGPALSTCKPGTARTALGKVAQRAHTAAALPATRAASALPLTPGLQDLWPHLMRSSALCTPSSRYTADTNSVSAPRPSCARLSAANARMPTSAETWWRVVRGCRRKADLLHSY